MAAVCLVLGLALGYLFRGSRPQPTPAGAPGNDAQSAAAAGTMGSGAHPMPTLEQMKEMGDKQAAPLLEKLKTDPKDTASLLQVARIYESVHQFNVAADYYGKALEVDPKNVVTRTQMASCLYYAGDVDSAISQLQQSLKYSPTDANSLFNLGVIRWHGKQDAKGAVEAWQQLLKSNPNLEADKKNKVQKLIAEASQPGSAN
jgi:cytochrome c-type biogenesis protein CcmH/NrfG